MKKQVFIYAEDRAVVVVASSKKAAVAYLRLFYPTPASTLSTCLFPIQYDRAQQVLWYRDTRSRRCPDPFVSLLGEERIPADAFDAVSEEPAARPTRGPVEQLRLASQRFDALRTEAGLRREPPRADQVLAMPAEEQARVVAHGREQTRSRVAFAPAAVELPAPETVIELPSLPRFSHSWAADPGAKDDGGEVVVEGNELTLRGADGQAEMLPLRDWLRGRPFSSRRHLYTWAVLALREWLSTRLSPLQLSGLSRMPPDDPDLLELTRGLSGALPGAGAALRRLVGRRDEWLLEQAEWLLSWGPASAEAYAVLDAVDRPRARALGLERALRDVTASWFWAVVARAIVDGAEGVAWARTIVERDAEAAVSIAREIGEAHAWTEPVAAFFDVVARFDRLLSGPSRDELAFWRRRVGESSGFGGG